MPNLWKNVLKIIKKKGIPNLRDDDIKKKKGRKTQNCLEKNFTVIEEGFY